MNAWPSETKQQSPDTGDCGTGSGSDGCDLAGYDDLSCSVDGIAAEADYLKQHKGKLTERRAKFDTARTEYHKMRTTVEPTIAQLKKDLADPDAALCQVDAEDRRCLKEAWKSVEEELKACTEETGGCCVSAADRTFTTALSGSPTVPEIQALIARYEDQVDRVEKCFDKLVAEPTALRTRVDQLSALVKQIKENKNLRQAYAQMQWAGHKFATRFGGFATPAEFEECLCVALNASLAGRRKLASLTGTLAELTCQETGRGKRCEWLRSHVVEEIVNRCLRHHDATSA